MFKWLRRKPKVVAKPVAEDSEIVFFITKEAELFCRLTVAEGADRNHIVHLAQFTRILCSGGLFEVIKEAAQKEGTHAGSQLVALLDAMHFKTDSDHAPLVRPSEIFSSRKDSHE